MAAPRNVSATTGPSMYDRILVMATSAAPAPAANAARPAAPPSALNGTQRFVPPPRQRPEQPEQDEIAEQDDNPPSPPVFTFPQPGQNGFQQPGTFNNAPTSVAQPGMMVPAPQTITINPVQNAPQPQMPVGVPQPGMMVPAPQPTAPTQPGMIRPPGGK
jgi:hypothetical protein